MKLAPARLAGRLPMLARTLEPSRPSPALRSSLRALGRVARALLGILALLPVVAFFVARPPVVLLVLVAGLLALTLARPRIGWLAVAGLSPLGSLFGRLTGSPWTLTEPLVLAFLGASLLAGSARPFGPAHAVATPLSQRARPLALALLACVAASVVVDLVVMQVSTAYPLDFARFVFRFLWHDYYLAPRLLPQVPAAAPLLEGVALFAASAALTLGTPGLARSGARACACGASLAAAVNIWEFARRAASVNWASLWEVIALRVSYVFPDVNAAGSYFVMAFFVAVGLAAVSRSRRRAWWSSAALAALLGLWVSGSRTALLAAPVAGLLAGGRALGARSRATARAVAAAALVLALIASVYWVVTLQAPKRTVQGAVRWRAEMAATAMRMVAAHPLFGVGAGRFYELSYDYSSEEWRKRVPRENAHNNYLQVLAELGVTGFALFTWLVGGVLVAGLKSRGEPGQEWLVRGVVAGLLAFCLTALAGHPLLVREAAAAFWIVLGLSVGLLGEPETRSAQRDPLGGAALARRLAPWAVVFFVAVSVPFRVHAAVVATGVARAGMGFSQWHLTPEGTRFRWMDREARLFVPSDARAVTLPVRSPGGAVLLRVFVGGTVVARQVVDTSGWQQVDFELTPSSPGSYVAVDLLVGPLRGPAGDSRKPRSGDERVQIGMPATR